MERWVGGVRLVRGGAVGGCYAQAVALKPLRRNGRGLGRFSIGESSSFCR